jgi:hypothetical protein
MDNSSTFLPFSIPSGLLELPMRSGGEMTVLAIIRGWAVEPICADRTASAVISK